MSAVSLAREVEIVESRASQFAQPGSALGTIHCLFTVDLPASRAARGRSPSRKENEENDRNHRSNNDDSPVDPKKKDEDVVRHVGFHSVEVPDTPARSPEQFVDARGVGVLQHRQRAGSTPSLQNRYGKYIRRFLRRQSEKHFSGVAVPVRRAQPPGVILPGAIYRGRFFSLGVGFCSSKRSRMVA